MVESTVPPVVYNLINKGKEVYNKYTESYFEKCDPSNPRSFNFLQALRKRDLNEPQKKSRNIWAKLSVSVKFRPIFFTLQNTVKIKPKRKKPISSLRNNRQSTSNKSASMLKAKWKTANWKRNSSKQNRLKKKGLNQIIWINLRSKNSRECKWKLNFCNYKKRSKDWNQRYLKEFRSQPS